jgi:tRNA A-37 threonylcarbamoyl transferase component Bud32
VGRADFVPAFGPLLERAGLANYESVMACRQGLRLDKPGLAGRERIRLRLDWPDGGPAELYLKRYKTNGPAIREWSALAEVRRAGVATMEPVGMGVGPAGGFVIVTAVPGEALSRCMGNLLERFSQDAGAMAELADGLGMLAGRLQAAGLAHRDFYTAHIFCDVCDPTGPAAKTPDRRFNLYLIDMARVFRPRWRKWRWRAKDLAGLKQSLDSAWVHRHWSGVIAAYERQLGRRLPLWVCWLIDIRSWAGHRRAIRRLAASQASRP